MRQTVHLDSGGTVVLVDSVSHAEPSDAGAVVVSASHGGLSAGEFAAQIRPGLVTFNDAGLGKDEAGVAGLRVLDEAGIAACACDSFTGRIGDVADCWEHGVVSTVNAAAAALGIRVGMTIQEAAGISAR